jgi:hypothetical protein
MTMNSASTNALNRLLQAATRGGTKGLGPLQSIPGDIELDDDTEELRALHQQVSILIEGREDPFRLGPELLTYVSSQLRSVPQMQGLVATFSPHPRLPNSPTVRLLAVCQFIQNGVVVDSSNASIAICYSEILESLLQNPTLFNSHVYSSILQQFVRLIQASPKWLAPLMPLYSLLLVSESKRADSELIALDLFSESLEAVEDFAKKCDVDATLELLNRILLAAVQKQHDPTECLQALTLLLPKSSKLRELTAAECEALLMQLLTENTLAQTELISMARWYRQLAFHDEHREFAKLLLRGWSVGSTRRHKHFVSELGRRLENAMESKVDRHRIQYLINAFERGEISEASELLKSIERLTDFQQVQNLSTHRVLTASAFNEVDQLRLREGSQLISPELLRSRLDHWNELNSIHRGFTSRLISAKRGPFREPPDLVQFAIDVGSEKSVRYLNTKDANLFPGKGFLLTRLHLAKCFATSGPERERVDVDRFGVYKKAWPALAEAMHHLDDTEFVFLRGCLLISCKRREYFLPNGTGEHYSLIVFNDHFRNPFQEVAYLVPNEGVAKLLIGTQIPFADFVGFDQRRPDLNEQLQSPRAFLDHPLIRDKAIDVGGVSAILSGFENHLIRLGQRLGLNPLASSLAELSRRTFEHNQLIAEWEQQNHRYHQSEVGQKRMMELSEAGRRLEVELSQVNEQRATIFGDVEDRIWKLVDRYTNLHKLFCIAHAYWHRGYTAGRVITTTHIDDSIEEVRIGFESSTSQDELRLEESSEAVSNRNSIRMLVQAYEWHAMREVATATKEVFPILVVCDALQLGSQPDMDLYVDTYDMSVLIDGQRVELSQGRMAGDDELFWFSEIVPRIQDAPGVIRDLRFYPRASLGMQV